MIKNSKQATKSKPITQKFLIASEYELNNATVND